MITKFLGTLTLNICVGASFEYCNKWLDGKAPIAYKWTLLETFFWEFSKASKTEVFPNISWKLYKVIFYKRLVSRSRNLSLIEWLHYRPFPGKLPTISEHSKETFFLESAFAGVRNCGLQTCNLTGKGIVLQRFLWNFWTFRTFFSFWALLEKYL